MKVKAKQRRFIDTYTKFLLSRSSLCLLVLVAICVSPIIALYIYLLPLYPHAAENYMLSSVSQVLAAVLGLTFTVVFVVIQLVTGYSPRLVFANRKLVWLTSVYLFLFVQAIAIPLVVLRNPQGFWFSLSFFEGLFVLVLLPFYLLFLLRELNPDRLLRTLSCRIVDMVREGEEIGTEIGAFGNYLVRAYRLGDYDTLERGINALRVLIESISKEITYWEFVTKTYNTKWLSLGGSVERKYIVTSIKEKLVLESFVRIIHSCTLVGQDPYAPLIILSSTDQWGRKLLEKDFPKSGLVDYIIIAYSVMLLLCIERKYLDQIWWLLNFYKQIPPRLAVLYKQDAETWKQVCTDFLSSIICASNAIKKHTPEFNSFMQRIEKNASEKFPDTIRSKSEVQAVEFLTEIFPEL